MRGAHQANLVIGFDWSGILVTSLRSDQENADQKSSVRISRIDKKDHTSHHLLNRK